ncbi:MAG: BLUF domain-containing protein [Bacteroidota bacterium]|nr:BLUF domain-containing protein [Bacteroidota bacterium]
MLLSHLVYTSTRLPICTNDEITKILKSAEKNNPKLDITGILMYNKDKFVQCLEGDYKLISTLYDNIKKDPRHTNVVLLTLGPAKERLFPNWQMASKDLTTNKLIVNTIISESDKSLFEAILRGEIKEGTNYSNILANVFKGL